MKYYLIAGEASGDLHASNLMAALKAQDAAADFRFYGGDKMAAVGGVLVKHYRELAYMGFVPVLLHLPAILRGMRQCKRDIVAWHPDVVILVDYPGFNLDIAQFVHRHTNIPIYYYIAPKIWAWKEYRIRRIRRDVNHLFSILPFEVEFFEQKHHFPIHYVGNPCVDAIGGVRWQGKGQYIAILAGSRRQEIKDNLPTMLRAASRFQQYRLVIAGAPGIERDYYVRYIPSGVSVDIVFGRTYEVLAAATAALVTSGTATLETAIIGTPQVVCYYVAWGRLVSLLRRMVLKVPYISLVNLIAGQEVVSELVADGMTEDRVARELEAVLPGGSKRARLLSDYEEVARRLGPAGASERAARLMVKMLKG